MKTNSSRKEHVMWKCLIFWPMKSIFQKTISEWDSDYGLFTYLLTIIVACHFSQKKYGAGWKMVNPKVEKWICLIFNKTLLKTQLLYGILCFQVKKAIGIKIWSVHYEWK